MTSDPPRDDNSPPVTDEQRARIEQARAAFLAAHAALPRTPCRAVAS